MEPVAIVGIGCRFPGASGPAAYWGLLRDGRDAVREVPPDRWPADAWYDPDPEAPGRMSTRWGGFLDQVDRFDPQPFSLSPREAARMDPQQRLLLEVSWEALEDAGLPIDRLAGSRTGVFVGFGVPEYYVLQVQDPASVEGHTLTGNVPCIIANRISYLFDFRGPSIALDTACSSSLVAAHLACQSLRSGESTLALAGGVNLMLSPTATVGFTKLKAMSPDGRCHTFDASASGYVRGEGAGVVVLKLLSAALRDGDRIHAVLRGSAVNQDGRTNGLTAPNRWSQEAVVREAYRTAGVSPGAVQYVETHGTGTLLGDPIELTALGTVLSEGRPASRPCHIGSVKTNIGHLEAAAGIASLIKVALALAHQAVPPTLHFRTPNPQIPFDRLPLKVQREHTPWPEHDGPALAGVSSFGFGGTNAHVVLEEAPTRPPPPPQGEPAGYLLPLSARTPEALRALAGAYADLLDAGQHSLADVCYTASVGRSQMAHRLCVLGSTNAEICDGLRRWVVGEAPAHVWSGRRRPNRGAGLPGPSEDLSGSQIEVALALRFASGADVCWDEVYCGRERQRVALPTYPFQREVCWFGPRPGAPDSVPRSPASRSPGGHPLLGRRLRSPAIRDVVYETHWSVRAAGGGPAVDPEVFRDMALALADLVLGAGPWKLQAVALEGPCALPEAGELAVHTVLYPGNELRIFSLVEAPGSLPPHWALHFRAKVVRDPSVSPAPSPLPASSRSSPK